MPDTLLKAPRRLFLTVAGAAALGAGAHAAGQWHAAAAREEMRRLRTEAEGAERLLLVLTEGKAALRGALAYGTPQHLQQFQRATDALEAPETRAVAAAVDAALGEFGPASLEGLLDSTITLRRRALRSLLAGERDWVVEFARSGEAQRIGDEIRRALDRFVALCRRREEELAAGLALARTGEGAAVAATAALSLSALGVAWRQLRGRVAAETAAHAALARSSGEVGSLLRMSELLQACQDATDVERVVAHAAREVLPGAAGTLFVFSNSRDRLDRAARWGDAPGQHADHFAAGDCWALKRGRPHGCGGSGGLACEHARGRPGALCIPMAARGEVYGVLQFGGEGKPRTPQGEALATALADAVSLALANLALRERLRGQALRDPLTGLYNRRFLEEVSERFALQAERRGSPLALAMLDVDHFKRLNDAHGHGVGDAVLRGLGQVLQSGLRRADVVCRYGGEEFLVLMPDCDLGHARERMDELRRMVAAMNEGQESPLPRVTVSVGVAALPECAGTLPHAIRLADEALYAAKQAGRDRVEVAPRLRPEPAGPATLRVVAEAAGG